MSFEHLKELILTVCRSSKGTCGKASGPFSQSWCRGCESVPSTRGPFVPSELHPGNVEIECNAQVNDILTDQFFQPMDQPIAPAQPSRTLGMTVSRAPLEDMHAEEGHEGQLKRMRGGCVPCVSGLFQIVASSHSYRIARWRMLLYHSYSM